MFGQTNHPPMQATEKMPVNPDVIVDEEGVEYLLLSAALKLLPGVRAGKKVHVNTAHRMIRDGRLKAKFRQVGLKRYWYVRRDQLADVSRLQDYRPPVADNRESAGSPHPTLDRMRQGRAARN